MPYGLSSGPSVFQNFVNDVLRDFLGKILITYIGDIYSTDYDLHVQHVCQVLTGLRDSYLYIKGEKCKFHMSTTSFLGYVISPDGTSMDMDKVWAVSEWELSKNFNVR